MEGIFVALDLVAEREEDIFFIWCDVGEYSTRHRKTRKREMEEIDLYPE